MLRGVIIACPPGKVTES